MVSWPSSHAAKKNKITITAKEIATNSFSVIFCCIGLLRFFFVRGMASDFFAIEQIDGRFFAIVGELRKDGKNLATRRVANAITPRQRIAARMVKSCQQVVISLAQVFKQISVNRDQASAIALLDVGFDQLRQKCAQSRSRQGAQRIKAED